MAKAKSPFILGLASKSNREPPRHFIKTAAFKLINPSVKHSCSHRAEFGSPEYDGGVNSDIFFSSSYNSFLSSSFISACVILFVSRSFKTTSSLKTRYQYTR